MNSTWDNFLKNLGEWQGSFTTISPTGEILDSTASILQLEGLEDNTLVRFRIRRYSGLSYDESPTRDYVQEYRTMGRQNIFFDTGAFSKGTIQTAPFVEFGAEYGFVHGDRRLRFVQLYDREMNFNQLVLIREQRQGTTAPERPPLTIDQLLGRWEGQATTAYADWRDPDSYKTCLELRKLSADRLEQKLTFGDRTITSTARIEGDRLHFEEGAHPREMLLLPDGGSSNVPRRIPLRETVMVEAGWLVSDQERQRLIRSYNEKGEWVSATHVIEYRQTA
jgi:Domain of unknown function (DUF3598)